MRTAADWAAWLHDTCQVGRLVRRPSGPPRHVAGESGTVDGGAGPLAREGELYLDKLFAGVPDFLVVPVLMAPVCLISRGPFEEQTKQFKNCFETVLFQFHFKNVLSLNEDKVQL